MMHCTDQVELPILVANALHDIKNTMTLFNQSLELIASRYDDHHEQSYQELITLHQQSDQMSIMLMQLLSLYRTNHYLLPINVEEIYLDDLFEDIEARFHWIMHHKEINLTMALDSDLVWYGDSQLILFTLNNAVSNALRFAKKNIQIKAETVDKRLILSVNDDGPGFNNDIIKSVRAGHFKPRQINSQQTGLGLYFAELVAKTHYREQRRGNVKLTNKSPLGGGQFQLCLP